MNPDLYRIKILDIKVEIVTEQDEFVSLKVPISPKHGLKRSRRDTKSLCQVGGIYSKALATRIDSAYDVFG